MKIKWHSLLIYAVFLLSGCGFADDFYSYSSWSGTTNQEKVRRKHRKIKTLTIHNYTQSIFPNKTTAMLERLQKLYIYSDDLTHFRQSDTIALPPLAIDTQKLQNLNLLKELSLQGFQCNTFPEALLGFKDLEKLWLTFSGLKTLDVDMRHLQQLRELSLYLPEVQYIASTTRLPVQLELLSLQLAPSAQIPSEVFENTTIKTVQLELEGYSRSQKLSLLQQLLRIKGIEKVITWARTNLERNWLKQQITDPQLLRKLNLKYLEKVDEMNRMD